MSLQEIHTITKMDFHDTGMKPELGGEKTKLSLMRKKMLFPNIMFFITIFFMSHIYETY